MYELIEHLKNKHWLWQGSETKTRMNALRKGERRIYYISFYMLLFPLSIMFCLPQVIDVSESSDPTASHLQSVT